MDLPTVKYQPVYHSIMVIVSLCFSSGIVDSVLVIIGTNQITLVLVVCTLHFVDC